MPTVMEPSQPILELIQLREEHGLSQGQAAKLCGLEGKQARKTLSLWEHGTRPSPERRQDIAGYLWDVLEMRKNPDAFLHVWNEILVERWEPWDEIRDDEWGRLTNKIKPVGSYGGESRPAVPQSITAKIETRNEPFQPVVALSQVHLAYLRRFFGKPWANVSLADMLEGRSEEIKLLDIYVPLRVDFEVVVKTQDHMIVDWWAKQEQIDALKRDLRRAQAAVEAEAMAAMLEQPTKLRAWPELGVGEDGLQQIVDGIQRTIAERHGQGKKTEDWRTHLVHGSPRRSERAEALRAVGRSRQRQE